MDQSYSENDLSLSPSQLLERLQVLRQLQLLQRGKLQKQRLQYQESSINSSSVTEIVSHFSNSTSYNTFRSLLQSSHDISKDSTPRQTTSDKSPKIKEHDLLEGVAVLNLSKESEFIVTSPSSNRSKESPPPRSEVVKSKDFISKSSVICSKNTGLLSKKHISLDEIPILSPRKDFEALIIEKLKEDKKFPKAKSPQEINKLPTHNKKPFLRRGEGMSRFGLKKNDLIIQNTKSLPWKQRNFKSKNVQSPIKSIIKNKNKMVNIQLMVTESSPLKINKNVQLKGSTKSSDITEKQNKEISADENIQQFENIQRSEYIDSQSKLLVKNKPEQKTMKMSKGKHPLQADNGKTWASVLTNEQNDFLRQLKQSDYYKNFTSPAKSIVSDISCDDNLSTLSHEREIAEQNMFDLLENKVSSESFNLENSFINRFLKKNKLEFSGDSTPLVMQKCLSDNPDLLHLIPNMKVKVRNGNSQSDVETCHSEYTDCCSDACSSVSSCCSCKTVETTNNTTKHYSIQNNEKQKKTGKRNKLNINKEVNKAPNNKESQDDTVTEDNVMQTNMAEMNAKLITTSDLLKERLSELEDEIETFRKENLHLTKLREEVDLERQKFYEEKAAFEQKFNEEKILSEYYLAEEKEKLTKQKQTYERYVREMRGRLNKKDKDEVVHLKKEISDLKEEIRLKDAKSTTTTARLRNQLKIMEKEKKDLQDQVDKLKKENRRIQHSNDLTRRLTNIKYLAEINKKLTNMTTKETQSEVKLDTDIKYKAYEIERQSRSRKSELACKSTMRPRAKSVPNLKVTSQYAKYFSQRDAISSIEQNKTLNIEGLDLNSSYDDDNDIVNDNESINMNETGSLHNQVTSDNEDENHLEKLYMETFHSDSPKSNRSSLTNTNSNRNSVNHDHSENNIANDFFFRKSSSNSNSVRSSRSPLHGSISPHLSHSNGSKSPISILINKSNNHKSPMDSLKSAEYSSNLSGHSSNSHKRTKSPITSNQSSLSQRSATVIYKDHHRDKLMVVSPEPTTSKTSLSKTSLIPTEIRKPDGAKELKFPNGNIKYISPDGTYSKFVYYNGDVKENFYSEGRIKYFYDETKTYHTTHADGLEVLEFPDGQVEKRYKDGSSEIRLSNGSVRYFDPKNKHVREEWRFPDGAALTVAANGEQRIVFNNGQVEVHAKDHKRREFPDGTVKLVYNDGTSETRYASGRVRIKDAHGNLIMDSAPG